MTNIDDENIRKAATQEEIGSLGMTIRRHTDLLAGQLPVTARIRAPDEEYLRVDLVPLSLVARVEELRGDNTFVAAIFWMLAGSLLGVIASIITTTNPISSISSISWILLIFLAIFSSVFGYMMKMKASKIKAAEDKLYGQIWAESEPDDE